MNNQGQTMKTKQERLEYIKELEKQWDINTAKPENSKHRKVKPDEVKSTLTKFKPGELKRLNGLVMSKTKQNKFISLYSQFPNMTKCAKQVGISITSVKKAMRLNSEFKELVMACRDNISEDLKSAMVSVGAQEDARGANDRHRWLQAYDDDFKKQPDQIQVNTQINMQSDGQVKSILSRILPNDDQ